MNGKVLSFVGLLFFMVITSCTSDDGGDLGRGRDASNKPPVTAESNDSPEIIRGHYVFGHEVRTLRLCGKDDALWVIDRTELLRKLHEQLAPQTTPSAEIFVVAEGRISPPPGDGFGAEYSGEVTIHNVMYAAFEGFGCDFDWGRFIYRAQGNEPFWTLEVLPTEMRLTRLGEPDLAWTDVKESRADSAVIFHAIGTDGSIIQLIVEPHPSRDTMSGAYYGWSARLVLDDRSYRGFALRGAAVNAR